MLEKHKHYHAGVKAAQVESIHTSLDNWRLDKTSKRNKKHKYSSIRWIFWMLQVTMRKPHRAQKLMQASVTADCRPMCSHEREAASDSTGRDMSPTTRVRVMYGGNRAAFKSLCKSQAQGRAEMVEKLMFPSRLLNCSQTHAHT